MIIEVQEVDLEKNELVSDGQNPPIYSTPSDP
jgi:hypothetical protein